MTTTDVLPQSPNDSYPVGSTSSRGHSRRLLFQSGSKRAHTDALHSLSRLAPGSYDVLLDGVIIASLVRTGETNRATWTLELLMDVPPRRRPAPFTATEHTFGSLEEAQTWLGGAELQDAETQG